MAESTAPNNAFNLRCTYCGGRITVNSESVGGVYSDASKPCDFECDEIACGATWNMDGTVGSEPRFLRYPDLYEKPVIADDE